MKKYLFLLLLVTIVWVVFLNKPKLVFAQECSGCSGAWGDGCIMICCGGPSGCHDQSCDCGGGGGGPPPPPDSPVVAGYLRDFFYQPLGGIEVRWTDTLGNVRKRWTNSDGGYYFSSWANLTGDQRTAELNDGRSSTNAYEAYTAAQNPHTITAINPSGWYGAMFGYTGVNLAATPDPTLKDLYYKNTPTASINGPSSGYVGQSYSFSASGNGPGMGVMQIWWANATSDLGQAGSWTLLGQTGCDGSSSCLLNSASFIPSSPGTYVLTVNAFANFQTPTTWCSGNPVGGAYADCNAGYSFPDYVYMTVTNAPVNGGWTGWGTCSATCGGGTQSRSCTNPSPAYGGLQCLKNDGSRGLSDTQVCNTQDCPITPPPPAIVTPTPPTTSPQVSTFCINGSYTGSGFTISWSNPPSYPVTYADISSNSGFSPYYNKGVSGTSTTAPGGFLNGGNQLAMLPNTTYYTRVYNGVPTNGGHSSTVSFGPFADCPIPGGWSGWSAYGSCSVACGGGTQSRTRTCNNPSPQFSGTECQRTDSSYTTPANRIETQNQGCNAQACQAFLKTNSGDVHSNQ